MQNNSQPDWYEILQVPSKRLNQKLLRELIIGYLACQCEVEIIDVSH